MIVVQLAREKLALKRAEWALGTLDKQIEELQTRRHAADFEARKAALRQRITKQPLDHRLTALNHLEVIALNNQLVQAKTMKQKVDQARFALQSAPSVRSAAAAMNIEHVLQNLEQYLTSLERGINVVNAHDGSKVQNVFAKTQTEEEKQVAEQVHEMAKDDDLLVWGTVMNPVPTERNVLSSQNLQPPQR
jgi:hypothetical protein